MELALDPRSFMANDALPQHANMFAGIGIAVAAGATWLLKKLQSKGEEKPITVRDWRNTEDLREALNMLRGGLERLEVAMSSLPAMQRTITDMGADLTSLRAISRTMQNDISEMKRQKEDLDDRIARLERRES